MQCRQCPHECGVDRTVQRGRCGVNILRIARYGLHHWEEPIISGDSGSGTIFFSGCPLKCIYCQNYEVSHRAKGYEITARELADIMHKLEDDGAHNINLVSPTQFVEDIMRALDVYRPDIPIVYNTGGYESVETINKLKGYIDIYLTDMKYSDTELAREYSGVSDYPKISLEALKVMRKQTQDVINKGLMHSGVIVRHLVLPNALKNTQGVIDTLAKHLTSDTYISLMSQYTPCAEALNHPKIGRKLKPLEYKLAVNYIEKAGFYNVFIQSEESVGAEYIPSFEGDVIRE